MTDYTPKQEKLIEKHRDCNVDYEWHADGLSDFIEVAKSYDIEITRDDVQFSGFSSQGDGASFTFGTVNAYDVIMAALKVEKEKPYGPGGYADEFATLGKLLLDAFDPYVLTCPEGAQIAESYCFRAERTGHHYSHSSTVTVRVDNGDLPGRYRVLTGDHQLVWNALSTKIFGEVDKNVSPGSRHYVLQPSLEDALDSAVKAIADALYTSLSDEYDYLTDDEQVWDTIVANEWDKDEDEDEEELEEAA